MSVQEALALHCVILGYPASACLCLCVCTPGIRQLQLMLLKVSLILGVEIHVNVEFTRLVEPPAEQTDGSECVCVCRYLCVMSGSGTPAYLGYTWKAFCSQNAYVKDISGSGSIYGIY